MAESTEFLVPCPGTYLVVQLDAVQMVEPLDDPVLTAAVRSLRTRKYIGHVCEVRDLPLPDNPDHKCCIALVGQGFCNEDENNIIDPTMCVPIFPETEHPLSRVPLRPTPSFPFDNCYQYTFATSTVRIPTKQYDHAKAVSLDVSHLMAHERYVSEDSRKRLALRDVRAGIVRRPYEDDSDSCESRSLTSAEVRELASQGVPVYYTKKTQPGCTDTLSGLSGHSQTSGAKVGPCDVARVVLADQPAITMNERGSPPIEASPKPALPQSKLVGESENTGMSAPNTGGAPPERTTSIAVLPSPELLGSEQDASDSASTVSTIQSVSDHPSIPRSPIPDVLMQAFLGDPSEDRDMIPLVNVSLDLSEVSEVHDPNGFFDEVDEIVRLIQESRDRYVGLGSDCKSMTSGSESWVDLAANIASSDALDAAQDEDDRPSMHGALHRARFRAKMKAKQARHRVVAILTVVTAVITCSFRVHVTFTLDD